MDETKIRDMYEHYEKGSVFVLKVTPDDYKTATISTLKEARDTGASIIYIGVKRPYVHLHKELQAQHIPDDDIYVVDTITKTITTEGVVAANNVRYLDSPQNLSNIGTAVSLMAEKTSNENTFLILDSLEALVTYNSETAVAHFLEDLKDRARTLDFSLTLFKQSRSIDEKIGDALYQLVDEVLILSDDESQPIRVDHIDDTETTIKLPTDILRSLKWEEGDELMFNITRSGTLELEKK